MIGTQFIQSIGQGVASNISLGGEQIVSALVTAAADQAVRGLVTMCAFLFGPIGALFGRFTRNGDVKRALAEADAVGEAARKSVPSSENMHEYSSEEELDTIRKLSNDIQRLFNETRAIKFTLAEFKSRKYDQLIDDNVQKIRNVDRRFVAYKYLSCVDELIVHINQSSNKAKRFKSKFKNLYEAYDDLCDRIGRPLTKDERNENTAPFVLVFWKF